MRFHERWPSGAETACPSWSNSAVKLALMGFRPQTPRIYRFRARTECGLQELASPCSVQKLDSFESRMGYSSASSLLWRGPIEAASRRDNGRPRPMFFVADDGIFQLISLRHCPTKAEGARPRSFVHKFLEQLWYSRSKWFD